MEHSHKYLDAAAAASIFESFRNPGKKLLLLDYDGTLVPFRCEPSKALPDNDLIGLLHEITAMADVELVIISGRNRDFLEMIFGDLDVSIFAEHGSIYRIDGAWNSLENDTSWKDEIGAIMNRSVNYIPGSNLEIKQNSLVWHFRKAENDIAEREAVTLINNLAEISNRYNLTIMKGRKIIEVKPSDYTKGTAIIRFFDCESYSFILAAGDDVTDEDLFEALPESAIKIHIGNASQIADYFIRNSIDFVSFLKEMIGHHSDIS